MKQLRQRGWCPCSLLHIPSERRIYDVCELTCAAGDFLTECDADPAITSIGFIHVQATALDIGAMRGAEVLQKDRLGRLVNIRLKLGKATNLLLETRKSCRN